MEFNHVTKFIIVLCVIVIAIAMVALFTEFMIKQPSGLVGERPIISKIFQRTTPVNIDQVKKFTSEDEFKDYLNQSSELAGTSFGGSVGSMMAPMVQRNAVLEAAPTADVDWGMAYTSEIGMAKDSLSLSSGEPDRYSSTNVQVFGIDEPDIVKTDGKELYYSSDRYYYGRTTPMPIPMIDEPMLDIESGSAKTTAIAPRQMVGGIKAIKAFPPADLEIDSIIEKYGNLLLSDNVLMLFENNHIYGYDVSDPSDPQEEWDIEIKNNSNIVTSRLYGDKIYVVTQTRVAPDSPCPIRPLTSNGREVIIGCMDVYHPVTIVPVDVTYSLYEIEADTGKVIDTTSFIGSSNSSLVYMSTNAVYVTYFYPGDFIGYIVDFFKENSKLVPSWLTNKLAKLQSYDLSDGAKFAELTTVLEQWQSSLDRDERLKIENELENKMSDYHQEHRRELERTGIVRIDIDDLDVTATGSVPGMPLNQFSLDEYQDHLRVATTIGEGSIFGMGSRGQSANDVYILDDDLDLVSWVKDMGLTERIYAVRFVQDKGYVVTFRQTDPFYVLDLSDPKNPELTGELKIPGYSSYLHPITKDDILGIGKEGSKVKVSLFDVRDPEDPQEADKYMLDDYHSDILNTHHAFLLDSKHKIFFLPGSRGGYVFSYAGNKLEMVKAVSDINAQRAIFINDYLYIISQDSIVVLNEVDWERINELELY